MNHRELLEIIEAFDNTTLTRIRIEKEGHVIEMDRYEGRPLQESRPLQANIQEKRLQPQEVMVPNEVSSDVALLTIDAPLVGIYYGAPSPEDAPFVKIGDRVEKGTVLCILEAMKVMNEVTAPYTLEVVDMCISNESLVEFGQSLFKVKKL